MLGIDRNSKANDRYDQAQFSAWHTDVPDHLNSYFEMMVTTLPQHGTYRVPLQEEHRPDLIAYRVYGVTGLWWVLLAYNGIIQPESIHAGQVLIYPSLTDIETLLLTLSRVQ